MKNLRFDRWHSKRIFERRVALTSASCAFFALVSFSRSTESRLHQSLLEGGAAQLTRTVILSLILAYAFF
jgi:hypothetical protein